MRTGRNASGRTKSLISFVTGDRLVRLFGRELASTIPLPHEAQVVAMARGVQITGILLCVINGDDLRSCQCFIDLALAEAETTVERILMAGMDDWTGLAAFPGRGGRLHRDGRVG